MVDLVGMTNRMLSVNQRLSDPSPVSDAMVLAALNAHDTAALREEGLPPRDTAPTLDWWRESSVRKMRAALEAAIAMQEVDE